MNDLKGRKWTVEKQKIWTVQKQKNGRSKGKSWTVIRDERRRSKNDPRIKSMLVTEIGDKFGMLVTSQVTN